jgi:glycerol-3-phosphate acyltransferase PlsY
MSDTAIYILGAAAAYLLGAIPFGLLLARSRGVDIRTVGSGNIGATNVWRHLGRAWGITTLVLDAIKGFVPAFVFPRLAVGLLGFGGALDLLGLACGVAAIAGHNWPVYLKFRGGKGVATSAGVLLGIAPLAVAAGLVVWLALFFTTHYVSVASMGAGLTVAAAGWVLYAGVSRALPVTLTLLALIVVWRHRSNIHRLRQRTESKSYMRKKER